MLSKRGCFGLAVLFIVFGFYAFLFYLTLTYPKACDFASLYSALKTLIVKENPYTPFLDVNYLANNGRIFTNLNPPFVLWLFSPLIYFNYFTAFTFWWIFSFILGLIGAGIAFSLAFSSHFLRKNWLILFLLYLILFSTATNLIIGQLGALLLFFTMAGYYCYLENRHYLAGILWGVIIACKLFPGLLFFYALKQRRYKVLIAMVITVFMALAIPLIAYGTPIYTHYYSITLHSIQHSGNWNASIYGFLLRIFVPLDGNPTHNFLMIKVTYGIIFFAAFIWYLRKLGEYETKQSMQHQSFCFTLIMMLLMSPLGWLYYFPLLVFPLSLTWVNTASETKAPIKISLIWLLCLFLLNFPMNYLRINQLTGFINRMTFLSFYFYGLLLLTYLVTRKSVMTTVKEHKPEMVPNLIIAPTLAILGCELIAHALMAL